MVWHPNQRTTMLTIAITRTKIKRDYCPAVLAAYKENPTRLYNALALDVAPDRHLCCITPGCRNGRGERGTGIRPFITDQGVLCLRCDVCGKCYGPYKLVMVAKGCTFDTADDFLQWLYTTDDGGRFDGDLRVDTTCSPLVRKAAPLVDCIALREMFQWAVRYAQSCTGWRQRQADALGLPEHALLRDDIGKSYTPKKAGVKFREDNDGMEEEAGDLVFFSLRNRVPVTVKVRHDPAAGYKSKLSYYNANAGRFICMTCEGEERTFRTAGQTGIVCFGMHRVSPATETVIITEGQTDTLAVAEALHQCGCSNMEAVARDSCHHVLSDLDLSFIKGRNVIYCEDPDEAGKLNTRTNTDRLLEAGCRVTLFHPEEYSAKDPRALFVKYGATALVEALFTTNNQ